MIENSESMYSDSVYSKIFILVYICYLKRLTMQPMQSYFSLYTLGLAWSKPIQDCTVNIIIKSYVISISVQAFSSSCILVGILVTEHILYSKDYGEQPFKATFTCAM